MSADRAEATATRTEESAHTTPLTMELLRATLVTVGAVLLAFLLVAPLLMLGHLAPITAYHHLLLGAVGSPAAVSASLLRASPLILIGLGVAIGMRAGFFNIGGQGQLYCGAVAATWFVLTFSALPASLLILGAAVVSASAGGVWALLAALARVFRGANEIVTTLLLNYVAVGVVDLIVYKPLRNGSNAFPQSAEIPNGAMLPNYQVGHVSIGLGIIVGVVLAVLATLMMRLTAIGYEIRAMSTSLSAARYAGIRVRRHLLTSAIIGGGLAGIAGAFEVMGVQLRLSPDFFPSEVAFSAVLVALLGGCRPIGVVVAGLLMGALTNGGSVMQQATSAPSVMVYVLEALVLLFVLAGMQVGLRGGWHGLRRTLSHYRAIREAPVGTSTGERSAGGTKPKAPVESASRANSPER